MSALIDFLRVNWRWLVAGMLMMFASSFGQTFFLAIFAGEIRAEFDLSHGGWGLIYTVATTSSAAVMVMAGGLTDRFRARSLGIAALLLLATASVAMWATTALWALVVVSFALRLMGQGMMGHIALVAMARWFSATRGRAVSIATLGVASGEALLPLGFVALMGVFAWRELWLLAAMILVTAVPILYILLQRERTPQLLAQAAPSPGMLGRDWNRGEVLRHWLFWMALPAVLAPPTFNTAFFFHQVHLAEVKGWEHVALVALFPAYTAVNMAAMLGSGWLIDRFGSGPLASVFLLPITLGYVLMAGAEGIAGGLVAMLLMGVSVGAGATLGGAFWAEYYGTRHLGAIRAMTAACMVFGTAIGPGITGVLIDTGITFDRQMVAIAGLYVIATGCAALGVRRARGLLPNAIA